MSNVKFEELGGRPMLEKVMTVFYDKIYAHPWIGKFFADIPQDVIEVQQVDFLQGSLGGEKVYCGKLPLPAHFHMLITDELYDLRSKLLIESLHEVKAPQALIDSLIKIDDAFKSGLVKNSVSECKKRFVTDEILDFPNPDSPYKKAA